MMTLKNVYRSYCCHKCDKDHADGTKLRDHLKKHGIHWKGYLGKRAVTENNVNFILKKNLENYETNDTWYMCGACDKHYVLYESLRDHIDYSHGITITNEAPLDLNIDINPVQPTPTKKRKMEDEISQNIFHCTTPQEFAITKAMLNSFNVLSVSMNIQSNTRSALVNINTSQEDLETMTRFANTPVTYDVEVGAKTTTATKTATTATPISPGDDYVHRCLQKLYPGLLKYQKYEEINDPWLNILNQEWKKKPFLRIVCGQLLAGAILVEDGQALLINCVELYNRTSTIDPHHERFGARFMIRTTPSLRNRYKDKLNVMSKVEDKSKKLLIGTYVFNALVTSSIRIDNTFDPELGASTFLFSPSKYTKVYISSLSIEQANASIREEAKFANTYDYDSQLRQVRSRLTNPKTYVSSRFCSKWTDQLSCRPYTIFTLANKSQNDSEPDQIIASSILVKVADSIRFEKGVLQKSALNEIVADKKTKSMVILEHILDLFEDEEELNIIGHRGMESLLGELAEVCTNKLKTVNDSIKGIIIDSLHATNEE